MNQEKMIKLEEVVKSDYTNIAGIVVLKDGRTFYEDYFNECTADSRIHIYFMSIVNILHVP